MKRQLCVAVLAALIVGSVAHAGTPLPPFGGIIGIYSDPAGYCTCLDAAPFATHTVYIVHKDGLVGALMVRFRVTTTWSGFAVNVTYSGPTLGDLFNGVSVAYYGCKTYPYIIASMTLYATTPIPGSTEFWVEPDPYAESGEIEVTGCDNILGGAFGGRLLINTPGCASAPFSVCAPVATEPTTWGQVKSLYW